MSPKLNAILGTVVAIQILHLFRISTINGQIVKKLMLVVGVVVADPFHLVAFFVAMVGSQNTFGKIPYTRINVGQ